MTTTKTRATYAAINLQTVSIKQLKQVISIKEEIATLENKLAKLTGEKALPAISPEAPAKKARKGMSAAGRAKIIAAQMARSAKVKAAAPAPAKSATVPELPKKGRKKMSAAAKAKIAAAAKARWAKIKGTALAPASKTAPAAKPVNKKGGISGHLK